MNPAPTIDALGVIERVLPVGDPCERVRVIQVLQDALDAAKAEALAEIDATKAYEADGASTLNTWVRNQLRMTAADAATLVRASATFAALPLVAAAAAEGSIRADHVRVFTYGLKHLSLELMAKYEEAFVILAQNLDPAELFIKMRELRDTLFPDDLDEAYIKGMEKEDIQVSRLIDGWHVTGFLNAATGLKFKKVLDSVSAPRDAEDDRTGAERRVQDSTTCCPGSSTTVSRPTRASARMCRSSWTPTRWPRRPSEPKRPLRTPTRCLTRCHRPSPRRWSVTGRSARIC